ncbi:hypothetical protein [Bacillus toyonensis]|uniref:hypothetical protein n=1 Tax=Bacillus toyonensis TaxID=155322 RepID=UPI002E202ECC|nr:hypothetical protein [Bacillus toyonensis]
MIKTELTRNDLLKNISATRKGLEELKVIEEQIGEIYKEPLTGLHKKMIATVVNVGWIGLFAALAINFVGLHLLIFPVLYFIFRGSVVAERINRSFYKKQLEENEHRIDKLYHDKGEKEYEINTLSMLEKELHNITMLKKFESYLETKQAITINKCMELYKSENK